MSATRGSQSPTSQPGPIWWLAAVGGALWASVAVSAKAWSSTGWWPSSAHRLFDLLGSWWHPERIEGSGLEGSLFGVSAIATSSIMSALLITVALKFGSYRAAGRSGLASRQDLRRLSAKEVVAKSTVILGSHCDRPSASGKCLGRSLGRDVWVSSEETILILAPPRAGKTSRFVAPAVAAHEGPVIATGVRSDIMDWTVVARRRRGGRLWLCEPVHDSQPLPAGVDRVRWSPLAGCGDEITARLRVESLFSALPKGGSNDDYWRTEGQTVLAAYFQAAALADLRMSDVVRWAQRDADPSAVEILRRCDMTGMQRITAHATADGLEAAIGNDPRYKAGVWGQLRQALDPFRVGVIAEMCDVDAGDGFDPSEFLSGESTIWMLGSESHQRIAAGVCCALTAAIIEAARSEARKHGRLRPPLLAALDEAVNVAPVPRLDQLLSTGGGSGIQTMIVLQSLAAARNQWGKEMGDALLDFNTIKIVLGGLADAQDLNDISTLLGQRDETVTSASLPGRAGMLDRTDLSWQHRLVPVMRPDEIRELDTQRTGEALVITRASKAIVLRAPSIFDLNNSS